MELPLHTSDGIFPPGLDCANFDMTEGHPMMPGSAPRLSVTVRVPRAFLRASRCLLPTATSNGHSDAVCELGRRDSRSAGTTLEAGLAVGKLAIIRVAWRSVAPLMIAGGAACVADISKTTKSCDPSARPPTQSRSSTRRPGALPDR